MYLEPLRIDILLGASVYAQIIQNQIVMGQSLQPIALSSKLGCLLAGNISSSTSEIGLESISLHCSNSCEHEAKLLELVQDFWRAEEISVNKKSYSPDEQVCEELYKKTTRQDETRQYIVSLPSKSRDQLSSAHLENSYSATLRALNRLEANFAMDEKLKLAYIDFMKEYIDIGHMSLSSNSDSSSNTSQAFLPHHGVWKETSTTTKLRTVFNGSSKTKSGVSVNDLLHVGPNLLQNPVALICAWRRYKIALSADVEKMFRQIRVESVDQPYQSILWRFDKSEPI